MRPAGSTRVLGLREGPSENATVTTGLLEALVERGLQADRRRLFVIDGAKALRRCGRSSAHPTRQPLAQRRGGGAVGGDDVL